MSVALENPVMVVESGNGPYAQSITIRHHSMSADESETLGGHDTGPSPYEYLMAGLGACTAMTIRLYATNSGWPLEKISVAIRHEKIASADGKSMIDRFDRVVHLIGGLTDHQRARLLEIAQKCPVSQTLQRSSLVLSSLG